MSISGFPRNGIGLTETLDVQSEHVYGNRYKQPVNNFTLHLLKCS
ncbi:hypothetical protein D3OALGA1CA_2442 [Olavius algarvensis associated proteobacterium Delta 3]|nr:hypothetical protein D3OALGA1CA_2442 [Olavius algarvensis associated proteobacterium Delta 3]CAB5155360.1 hypothetical protein D3OALGB2SA_5069 [Olavius algarvensis associated proteobacterium Delta 3]